MKNPALAKFTKSFWEARRLIHKNLPNASEQAFRKVAEDARNNKLLAEALIADAAGFEIKGRFEEAIRYLELAISDDTCQLRGIAHFILGSVYKERFPDQPEKAIRHYEKAIGDETFDKRAWALNNLGNIYFRLAGFAKHRMQANQEGTGGESSEREADVPSSNLEKLPPDALYEKAFCHYAKSLACDDPEKYITVYNQGRLYLAINEFDQAIARFDEATRGAGDNFDMHGSCYREMGTAHILKNLGQKKVPVHDAVNCWEKAKLLFEEADRRAGEDVGGSGKSAVVQAKIRVARSLRENPKVLTTDDRVLLEWWPPEEAGSDGYSTPEERIFSMIEATGRDRYQLYNSRESSRFAARNKDKVVIPAKDVLAILRGWGSASPLIEDAFSACVGGGYFLKWQDKGLVIDPGFDFMRNFRANGFHMREVDAIVVSHDHTDHNADLRAIEDVFYEMSRRASQEETTAGDRNWHYYLICDERTKGKDYLQFPARHRTILEMNQKNFKDGVEELTINLRDRGLPFVIHYFKAVHGLPAYSFRIDCLSANGMVGAKIGFTCDTQHFEGLGGRLEGCNILVAHVSQPTLAELLKSDKPKEKHLGYRGVAKLIKECNPDLTVLGEFWAGFADMRIDITKGLKRICGDAAIVPSSVGLFITPKDNSPEIECSNCRKWRSASSMYVGAANQEYGPLAYLCPLCRI
jgi:tetratricopeptide (TPR) repeat protein/ribonuclease BN (tRNA processing enzyme)